MAKKKEIELDPVVVQNKARMDEIIEEIKSINAHREELKAVCEERVRAITESYQDKDVLQYTRIRHLEEELKVLMDVVPKQETKTQYKVSLLCGDVVLKKATKKLDYDKKKLLEWATSNGRTDLINSKTVDEFKWSEFKSSLAIQEGIGIDGIVDITTGEMLEIDGLSVVNVAEEVVIK